MMSAFCSVFNPPLYKRMAAIAARNVPMSVSLCSAGLKSHKLFAVPRTNVAESAEVMKNMAINTMARTDRWMRREVH